MFIAEGLAELIRSGAWLYTIIGVVSGLVVGAIPGLGPVTALALALPLTFGMDPLLAMVTLLSIYVGAVSGGGISSTLLNIPGTVGSIATCFDGFPMSQQGRGKDALGVALSASTLGAIGGAVALATVGPQLARVATAVGPPEYTMLIVMAFILVAVGSRGDSLKGLLMAGVGLLIAFVGIDPMAGNRRFTFGSLYLTEGVPFVPLVIGLFAMSQVLVFIRAGNDSAVASSDSIGGSITAGVLATIRAPFVVLRAWVIGVMVGILPGVGISLGGLLNWVVQKNVDQKNTATYGKGNPKGLVAAEVGNNATATGSLALTFSIGIPGGATDAILLGGLLMFGLQPGRSFFDASGGNQFYPAFMTSMLLAPLVVLACLVFVRYLARLTTVPTYRLVPVIAVLAVVGSYAGRRQVFDVWVMVAFGILGYFLYRGRFPVHNLIIAVVLGRLLEANYNRSMRLSGGSIDIFWDRPVARAFLIVCLLGLTWALAAPLVRRWRPPLIEVDVPDDLATRS